ncbi:NepR family anti-sigma factor [Parerythrobacter jejuensis]|uniref:Anti-sigma factor NepR domain-containing protein n=1 Tax=Parerythrobacter jejuensis TaxID=795812 RepID=A0A845AUA4_9SPHN|nr:NepR family anti-sigma factor [Parerythrobacter jejuensis]MXP30424.1 hypothetical protein [Parerythrobacter jejuensis]MXP33184.1 hypothetical protein [Parerythrobacter jejuensis]
MTTKPTGEAGTGKAGATNDASPAGSKNPEWADGLRQLYDSVVEEPLPDSFKDLLAKLDDGSDTDGKSA